MRDELNVETETSKSNGKNIVFIANFDHAIFLSLVGAIFLVKNRNWASVEISNLTLNACIRETTHKMFSTREKLALG